MRAATSVGAGAWGYALATFWIVFAILFTVFLTKPYGLWDGVHDGLDYWLSQQPVARGGEPWYFYLAVLFGEEWPVLVLGAVAAAVTWRRPTLLRAFLVWGFVVSLAVYSWAGEKFAWLILHPLLPLVLLAGVGIQSIWEARRTWAGRLGLAAVVVGFAYAGVASYWVNAAHRADPRELLVSTQSSEQTKQVAEQVVAADARSRTPLRVTVDADQGATFPYAWYFRHLRSVQYPDLAETGQLPPSDVVILTAASRDAVRGQLHGFAEREFPFRVWWVRGSGFHDYRFMTPGRAWAWLTQRKPWTPLGGLPEYLELKPSAER
jgi:predicted membrane-bound mannosyltransferase